jgi:hypothetical protein
LSRQIERCIAQAPRTLAAGGGADFIDRRPLGYQGTQ